MFYLPSSSCKECIFAKHRNNKRLPDTNSNIMRHAVFKIAWTVLKHRGKIRRRSLIQPAVALIFIKSIFRDKSFSCMDRDTSYNRSCFIKFISCRHSIYMKINEILNALDVHVSRGNSLKFCYLSVQEKFEFTDSSRQVSMVD